MEGKTFDLPSGAKLLVNVASFESADELKCAVAGELLKLKPNLMPFQDLDLAAPGTFMQAHPELLQTMIDAALTFATSKPVKAALWQCFEKAVYQPKGGKGESLHLSYDLMDDPKIGEDARGDYHAICMRVAEVNLRPFFRSLFSKSPAVGAQAPAGGSPA